MRKRKGGGIEESVRTEEKKNKQIREEDMKV